MTKQTELEQVRGVLERMFEDTVHNLWMHTKDAAIVKQALTEKLERLEAEDSGVMTGGWRDDLDKAKTGEYVYLLDSEGVYAGRWVAEGGGGFDCMSDSFTIHKPTHWQPIRDVDTKTWQPLPTPKGD